MSRPCVQCGDPLPEWARPNRKYCSFLCEGQARRQRDRALGRGRYEVKSAYLRAVRGRECRYCLIRDDEAMFRGRDCCSSCSRARVRGKCARCGAPVSAVHGGACVACDPPPPRRVVVTLLAPADDRERRLWAYWPETGHQRARPPEGGVVVVATPEQWRSRRLTWCLGSYAPSDERRCVRCRVPFVPMKSDHLSCPACVKAGRRLPPLPERACATCSASFVPRQRRQYACSLRCGVAHRNKMDRGPQEWREPRACGMCGASYVPRAKNQRFCQRQCKERWLRGGMRRER